MQEKSEIHLALQARRLGRRILLSIWHKVEWSVVGCEIEARERVPSFVTSLMAGQGQLRPPYMRLCKMFWALNPCNGELQTEEIRKSRMFISFPWHIIGRILQF